MASSVRDYMSARLVYLAEGSRPAVAMREMLQLGITTIPVLDEEHIPVGVVSLRDLVGKHEDEAPCVSQPALTVAVTATMQDAAQTMLDAGVHHLVVVDETGKAAGMLSALDVVRALIGAPPRHPDAIETFGEQR